MKLVIGWLILMIVLPLVYLFWWKKSWRLPLGIVILVILGISFFAPSEIVHSLVSRKIKQAGQSFSHQQERIKELNELHQKNFSLSASENPEKIKLEKEIVELGKWIKKEYVRILEWEKNPKGPTPNLNEFAKKEETRDRKSQLWKQKWSGVKPVPPLLLRGKELTQVFERLTKGYEIGELKYKKYLVKSIDFKEYTQVGSVQKELVNLIKVFIKAKKDKEEQLIWYAGPILWLKNLDQVKKGSELEKFLLNLLTDREKWGAWKYEEEKFNLTSLIVVANATNPSSLSPALRAKLSPYEPFLDKYQPVILVVSGVGEIIILFILVRINWKSRSLVKQK